MKNAQAAKSVKPFTPFDEIKLLEERERRRVEVEISAMRKEEEEVKNALMRKEQDSEFRLREEAQKELEQHRKQETKKTDMAAEKSIAIACGKLESQYESRKDGIIKTLVKNATNPDFLFSHF